MFFLASTKKYVFFSWEWNILNTIYPDRKRVGSFSGEIMKKQKNSFSPRAISARMAYLCKTFPFVRIKRCGTSLCNRPIEALVMGCGRKTLLFVGAHHGSEYLTANLLLDFAEELCRAVDAGKKLFSFSARELLERRTLILLPCVNPDGVALALCGASSDNPLGRKQIAMNCGSEDFSKWQANARGVDINHNYNYRFYRYKELEKGHGISPGRSRYAGDYPESEPETLAVCRLVEEYRARLSVLLSFHSQGEVIYYHDSPLTRQGARFLSRTSGYSLEVAEGLAAYGGLTDWANTLSIPAYTLEIGRGENPLPRDTAPLLYITLREMLISSLAFF